MAGNKKDICVIGIGRFGFSVVEQLIELKRNVLAMDKSEDQLRVVSRLTDTAIIDSGDVQGLKQLGIHKFETVIVGHGNNIETVAALMELGVTHIIAKATSTRHERVLRQIGVDVIVRPEADAGVRTALISTNPNFIKYAEHLQEIGDGYAIGTTTVTDKSWIGIPIKDLEFGKMGVNVVSIKRGSKVILPTGDTELNKRDLLTIIGKIPKITKAYIELNKIGETQLVDIKK